MVVEKYEKYRRRVVMKQKPAIRSSIAWFKLAECVERGEKERAFGLYRLLMHSHEREAFREKLEGDILLAFDEELAIKKYSSAAHHYREEEAYKEALFIYETLIMLCPHTYDYLEKVISLCEVLKWKTKSALYQQQLYRLLMKQDELEKAVAVFKKAEKMIEDTEKFRFYRVFVIAALHNKYTNQRVITSYLHKTLDYLMRFGTDNEITSFLGDISAINSVWHKDALAYIGDAK